MRNITEIIVHASATRPEWMSGARTSEKVAEIRRWHMTPPRNWRDIGYHYIIDTDGTIAKGRHDSVIGAHTKGRNRHSIGICLIGGHGSASTDRFEENFTQAQEGSLMGLLMQLRGKYGQDIKISGHNEYAAKACPGFNVPGYLWGKGFYKNG